MFCSFRKRFSRKSIWVVFAIFIFHIQPVSSETMPPGRIQGQVLDESTESPIIGAMILIEGTQLGAVADTTGRYQIDPVPSGIVKVRFVMMGYETRVVNSVVVNPNRTTWQKILLKPTILKGEGVTVTAGLFHEAKDAVVSNRSMDYEEIRMDAGSVEDIQRVVQALPAVVSAGDQENEIIIRGGMYGENLFVMDHIEIPNPNHFGYQGAGGGPISMINTQFVRQVDFYAGAFPARYGDKASSVLDISLRDGDRRRRTGHAELGMAGAGLVVEGPIHRGQGAYILSARKSFLDLIIASTGLTAVPKYYNLQGKIVYDFDGNNQLMVNGIYGNDRIHIKDSEENSAYNRGADDVTSLSHQYAFGATWKHLYGKSGYSKITLSQTLNYWDQYVHHSGGKLYTNVSTEIENTCKAEWTFLPGKRIELNFGGHVKSIPFDLDIHNDPDTIYIHDVPKYPFKHIGILQAYPAYDRENKATSFKTAAFGQVKIRLGTPLTATFGVRTDYFDYTRKYAIDPRLGFSYTLTSKTNINLAFGQHSQSPAYSMITAHPDNLDLDYKNTKQVVFGLERLFQEDIKGTFELFYKDYRKVPVSMSDLTSNPFDDSEGRLVNEGHGYAKGIELFLQKKMLRNYHFTLSYSYSISKAFDPRNEREFNWDFDYRHVFTAISGVQWDLREKEWYQRMKKQTWYKFLGWLTPFGDQVEVAARWRYLGGRPYSESTYLPQYRTWAVLAETPMNTARYPVYHRLDFRLDQRYMFDNWNLVMYWDIINIYGRNNIWSYSYNSDGTKEKVLQYKVFPAGGVIVEF